MIINQWTSWDFISMQISERFLLSLLQCQDKTTLSTVTYFKVWSTSVFFLNTSPVHMLVELFCHWVRSLVTAGYLTSLVSSHWGLIAVPSPYNSVSSKIHPQHNLKCHSIPTWRNSVLQLKSELTKTDLFSTVSFHNAYTIK